MFGKLINNDQLWDSTLVKLLDFKDMKKILWAFRHQISLS